jgi:hypothetical protein
VGQAAGQAAAIAVSVVTIRCFQQLRQRVVAAAEILMTANQQQQADQVAAQVDTHLLVQRQVQQALQIKVSRAAAHQAMMVLEALQRLAAARAARVQIVLDKRQVQQVAQV